MQEGSWFGVMPVSLVLDRSGSSPERQIMTVEKEPTRREIYDDFTGFGLVIREMEIGYERLSYEPILTAIIPQLQIDHKGFFSHKAGPDGAGWKENAASTQAKKGHGIVLFVTGDLERSLSESGASGAIRAVSDRGLLFGTSIDYSSVNQTGTKDGKISARPHVGLLEETLNKLVSDVADLTIESLKLH